MAKERTQADKTSADKKVLGFEYQYWFFLWRVLQLKSGESVGLEVSDDVHTELNDDRQILFQLKHSMKQKSGGATENLTKLDSDLWKTMSNWSRVITDSVDGRDQESNQLAFLKKTDFVLVTNKSKSVDETIPELLASPDSARGAIMALQAETKSQDIEAWMNDVLSLSDPVIEAFVGNVSLDLEVDEIVQRCKTTIAEKHIADERVDGLLRDLDSQIRQDNFFAVKSGKKVVVTFADFRRKYRSYFDRARSTRLQVRREYDRLPENLHDQVFVRQLLDIEDLQREDVNAMVELTTCKQRVEKNLLRWEVEGELTGLELADFDEETKVRWNNAFRHAHRGSENSVTAALMVLDKVRELDVPIGEHLMGVYFSNGQYYRLADIPEIGFAVDWQSRYGKGDTLR